MTEQRISTHLHDGLRFDVRDAGPEDGEVVVLLHGFPQTSTCWDDVVPHLHAQGYRTIAPDQRGYSPGARPRGRWSYRTELLVADVVSLIERIGSPVHLVGHDWGAVVSWGVCVARPDLVRTHTSVSVPHPAAFAKSFVTSRQLLRSWYILFFQLPWLPELFITRVRGAFGRLLASSGMDRGLFERVQVEVVDSGALSPAIGYYRGLLLSPGVARGRSRVPTTHVWSSGDSALDRAGAEACGDYVRAPYRLEVMEGASHWIPDQEPERLAQIVLERARG